MLVYGTFPHEKCHPRPGSQSCLDEASRDVVGISLMISCTARVCPSKGLWNILEGTHLKSPEREQYLYLPQAARNVPS